MIWRTDKPTAKLIAAYLKVGELPEILARSEHYGAYMDNDGEFIPFETIIKWASLDED